MSKVIIDDNAGGFWTITAGGNIQWAGTISGQHEIDLVGPITELNRNATPIFTGDTTGIYYRVADSTQITFAAYDGFETTEAFFHFAAYTFILYMVIRLIAKMLTNRNPSV